MIKLSKIFNKNELLKHVFTLVKGTVIAQLINISAQFVLRRVFTVEDFGVFALYIAMVTILYTLATGRYETAIVLPKDDNEAHALLKLSIKLSFIFSCIILFVLLILNNFIIEIILNKGLIDSSFINNKFWLEISIYLLPFGVFLLSAYNALNFWFIRSKKFNKVVNARVTNAVVNSSSTMIMGSAGMSFGGVIIGYLLAQLIGVLYFLRLKKNQNISYAKVETKKLMADYKDFPTKSLFSTLLNVLASQTPIIMLASFFGPIAVGLYELIIRILNIPITMIGKSVSQVFFQKISEDVSNGKEIGSYVKRFAIKLFLFMLLPMGVIFFFGETLFVFAFGKQYAVSGQLAAYFSLFYLVRFVYYSLSTLYTVKRKLGIELFQNSIYLASQIIALTIGHYYYNDFKITIILLALSGFLCYSFFMISLLKLANSK